MKTLTTKAVRDLRIGDSVGKNRGGHIVVRRGFFYRSGCTAEIYKERVITQLKAGSIHSFEVVDYGEHFTYFRGGAPISQQSHWWVELKPTNENEECPECGGTENECECK